MKDAESRRDARGTSEPIAVSEFRARLSEMIRRAENGEEVVIARERKPVAKLVPLRDKRHRRLGVLKDLMDAQCLAALAEAVDEPLSPADQAALEGKQTGGLGIHKP